MDKKRLLELAGINEAEGPIRRSWSERSADEILDEIDEIVSGEQMLGAEPYNLQRKLTLIKQLLDQR